MTKRLPAILFGLLLPLHSPLVHAESTWRCGSEDFLELTVYGDTSGVSPGRLDGPGLPEAAQHAAIDLACARQPEASGTFWRCRDAPGARLAVRVRIYRGNRTGDPIASAWVEAGDEVLASDLPCVIW